MTTTNLPADVARLPNVVGMHPCLPPMPKAARPGAAKEQWSLELVLVEGTPAYEAAIKAQQAAIAAKWPKGAAPANLKLAIKDPQAPSQTRTDGGPARRGEAYENVDGKGKRWYLRAASQFDFPCWVGRDRLAPKTEDIYSGAVWLAVVKFAAYSSPQVGSGVTAYLQLCWRTGVGKPVSSGGAISAAVAEGDDIQFDDGDDILS